MKRTIQNLTMAAALLLGAAAMSSCAGFVDALLGHEDTPAETPTKPTTSDANDGGSHEGSDMSLPPGAGFNIVDLSTLTEDYTFKDGDVLTGTLDGTKTVIKLSVAPDAKVILSGAQILGKDHGQFVNQWAGLTCLGNATIILDGENTVRSFNRMYPCIQAGPDGSKLIITGDGKLTTEGTSSAGIGVSNYIACGDIEIQGGDLTLKDSDVGIGSENSGFCANITISGGTITAQGDVDPGIGSGLFGSCGDISISWSENFVSLTAIKGNRADYAIGATDYRSCGEITFDGTIIKEREKTESLVQEDAYGKLKFTISTTLPEGVDEEAGYKDNTWTLTPRSEDE